MDIDEASKKNALGLVLVIQNVVLAKEAAGDIQALIVHSICPRKIPHHEVEAAKSI